MDRTCPKDENQKCAEKKYYELKITLTDEAQFFKVEAFNKAAKKLMIDPETKNTIEAEDWNHINPLKRQKIAKSIEGRLIKAKICPFKY